MSAGLVNLWINDIRDTRDKHAPALLSLGSTPERVNMLVELNVMRQVGRQKWLHVFFSWEGEQEYRARQHASGAQRHEAGG
jgi:hypothetical protein